MPHETESISIDGTTNQLCSEFTHALILKANLEREIESLTNSVLQDDSAISLPTELLTEIFAYVVETNATPLGRLMQVCPAWNAIILGTPRLWSTIRITFPKHIVDINKCAAYVDLHVKRAAGCPLDISINSIEFPTLEISLIHPMRAAFMRRLYPIMNVTRKTLSFLNRQNGWLYNWYRHHAFKPLLTLAGVNRLKKASPDVSRWRTFAWSASDLWISRSFMELAFITRMFTSPTPNLSTLDLRYKMSWNFQNDIPGGTSLVMRWDTQPFPELSNIRRLLLGDIQLNLRPFTADPQKFDELNIVVYDLYQYFFALKCQNLTWLRLGVSVSTLYVVLEAYGSEEDRWGVKRTVIFPQLLHLQIAEHTPSQFLQYLQAPRLQVIVFETIPNAVKSLHVLPSVTRVELRLVWSTYPQLETLVPMVVRHCPAIVSVLCRDDDKEHMIRVFQKMWLYDFQGPFLTTLLVVPEDKRLDLSAEAERYDIKSFL